jgi:hypothetical protein
MHLSDREEIIYPVFMRGIRPRTAHFTLGVSALTLVFAFACAPAHAEPEDGSLCLPAPPAHEGGAALANPAAGSLDPIRFAAETARGEEIVGQTAATREALSKAAHEDQLTLSEPYRLVPTQALGDYFKRAGQTLSETVDALERALPGAGFEAADRALFRNYFLNARDKAVLGGEILQNESQRTSAGNTGAGNSPFVGLLPGRESNPLARTPGLSEVFDPRVPKAKALGPDALVDRLLLLNGLSDAERAQTAQKLKLAEPLRLNLPGGSSRQILLLHNGQRSRVATDCLSLAAASLPLEQRQTGSNGLTASDYRQIWLKLKATARGTSTPVLPERLRKAAEAFLPIDLIPPLDHVLFPGDLVARSVSTSPNGWVALAHRYHPGTRRLEILEAAATATGLRSREIDLSVPTPDLYVLRLKAANNSACSYSNAPVPRPKTPPASAQRDWSEPQGDGP